VKRHFSSFQSENSPSFFPLGKKLLLSTPLGLSSIFSVGAFFFPLGGMSCFFSSYIPGQCYASRGTFFARAFLLRTSSSLFQVFHLFFQSGVYPDNLRPKISPGASMGGDSRHNTRTCAKRLQLKPFVSLKDFLLRYRFSTFLLFSFRRTWFFLLPVGRSLRF